MKMFRWKNQQSQEPMDYYRRHTDTIHPISLHWIGYLLVTGFPVKLRNSNLGQALPRLEISSKELIWFQLNSKYLRLGTFLDKLAWSKDSNRLDVTNRLDNRRRRGKFSNRPRRLSVKSIESKASRVTPKCSTTGMARPRKIISRSPNAFVRCSEELNKSADNLMIIPACVVQVSQVESVSPVQVNARSITSIMEAWGNWSRWWRYKDSTSFLLWRLR